MTDFTLAAIEHALAADSSLVIETSGSTGVPKRVRVSAAALRASAEATAARIGEGQWVLALPTSYVAGVQVLVRSVLAGTKPITMPPGPFRAADFVRAAEQLQAPGYISLVPAQLRTLLDDSAARETLAGFAAVLVGGQRVPSDLAHTAADAAITLVRTYGSTETAGGCVYDGYPLDGVALRIADGEVQVSGATLADGYLDSNDQLLENDVFVVEAGIRWYRTGDLGELAPDGQLSITGRADRVLISGGVNVSLDRLEHVLHGVPGLEQAAVIAAVNERWGEVPIVFVPQSDATAADLLDAARAAALAEIGPAAQPHEVRQLPNLPLTASAKPDYAALGSLL